MFSLQSSVLWAWLLTSCTALSSQNSQSCPMHRPQPSLWPTQLQDFYQELNHELYPGQQSAMRSTSAEGHGHRKASPFETAEATVVDILEALHSGRATCGEIISSYVTRIQALNPSINAITALNPQALHLATSIDQALQSQSLSTLYPLSFSSSSSSPQTYLPLLCTPLLIKDSFNLPPLATTASSLAFSTLYPNASHPNSTAASLLRLLSLGAIPLLKTNLHELALEGLTVSSFAGQTRNPYDLTRTPGGSSGGSGAALAAAFGVLATGTDTVNSLRSPASANAVLSVRPSRGVVERAGVVPVSATQDTVGVLARRAGGLWFGLRGMMVEDKVAAAAAGKGAEGGYGYGGQSGSEGRGNRRDGFWDRLPAWDGLGMPLRGIRIGFVEGFVDRSGEGETGPVVDIVERFVRELREAGAEVTSVQHEMFDPAAISALDVQAYEFREDLDEFLSTGFSSGALTSNDAPRSFEELFMRRDDYMVIPERYAFIQNASKLSRQSPGYRDTKAKIDTLRSTLDAVWAAQDLDFLLYPEQRNLVVKIGSRNQAGRNGHLAALTGFPVLAFPAGFSSPDRDAPRGVPVGVEIMGRPSDDLDLVRLAARLERVLGQRVVTSPELTARELGIKTFDSMPVVVPDRTIPDAYPLGRIRES